MQPGGRVFAGAAHEALVGSFAAERLGLRVGDTFQPYHGLVFDPSHQHEEIYTVVGILEPTNTPADRVLWIPLAGIQNMKGHDPKFATDLSAVLLQLRTPQAGFMLDMMYNRQGNRLTFAYPVGAIIADLFGKIGWFDRVLALVAYLVAFVAAGSVLAIVYGALLTGVARIIRAQTGVAIDVLAWHPVLWVAPLAMIALCALGGIIPALKAYRVPVAETLAPTS